MNIEEADEIFESWKNYIEISDKMRQVFTEIPESFLPYPKDILIEALDIMTKEYRAEGKLDAAEDIQNSIIWHLSAYKEDAVALELMKECLDFRLNNIRLTLPIKSDQCAIRKHSLTVYALIG